MFDVGGVQEKTDDPMPRIVLTLSKVWPARCFVPVGMRVYITGDTGDRDADGCGIARL